MAMTSGQYGHLNLHQNFPVSGNETLCGFSTSMYDLTIFDTSFLACCPAVQHYRMTRCDANTQIQRI